MVEIGRLMLGATDPLKSNPGTIRGDFGIDVGRLLSFSWLCLLNAWSICVLSVICITNCLLCYLLAVK